MKKDIVSHFIIVAVIFVLITIFRNWLNLVYWPFWVGGIFGLALPFSDYYITKRFMKPNMLGEYELVLDTLLFQGILFVLTFWVVTSSSSLLAGV